MRPSVEDAQTRARRRMDMVDRMAPDMRALVHEHGLTIVDAFLRIGVTKAKHIKHLIKEVRAGSQEIGNRERSQEILDMERARMIGTLRANGYTVIPPSEHGLDNRLHYAEVM